MNEKKLSRPLISLIVSIALIIVGIAGSFILQTNSGKTTIRNVTIESESGHTLAMDVYIPENATAETPAPAIFVQHGGNNNKEEMQHYCIELARRGYVAIGVDMYGMGESEPLPDSEWLTQGRGLYDAVRYGVTLPYVDTDRVSLLGYSRGGKAAGEALQCDNDSLNVVKAIFLIHSDPSCVTARATPMFTVPEMSQFSQTRTTSSSSRKKLMITVPIPTTPTSMQPTFPARQNM